MQHDSSTIKQYKSTLEYRNYPQQTQSKQNRNPLELKSIKTDLDPSN